MSTKGFQITCTHCGNSAVLVPQDDPKDGAPAAPTPAPKKSRKKPEEPRGAIPEFQGDPEVERFLEGVLHSVQERWLKLYANQSWIQVEILKAINWLETHPGAKRKDMGRFMSNWLGSKTPPAKSIVVPGAPPKKGIELLGEEIE